VFDLETRDLIGRGGAKKCHVSVLSAWALRGLHPYIWLLDSTRIPRVLVAEEHAAGIFGRHAGVVSWNGIEFDDLVLKGSPIGKAYARKRHIDLHAICCALAAGVEPERLNKLGPGWANMVPTLRADLVSTGWHLDAVGKGTFGLGKVEGPQGAEAVTAWAAGRWSEVASYCIGDVALTRALFLHAWERGFLVSEERGKIEIPRSVLSDSTT
jgi:hypothetical protein